MPRTMLLVSSALLASVLSTTEVLAAEGKFDWQSCYAGPARLIQHSDGIMSGSYSVIGMWPGAEGSPMHMLSGRCLGAFWLLSTVR